MINDLPKYMVICLVETILLELLLGFILGVRSKKDIINIILVNVLTNPIVVVVPIFFLFYWSNVARIFCLVILEILTIIVEGFTYKKVMNYKRLNPFILALFLNIFSYFVGQLIWRFI